MFPVFLQLQLKRTFRHLPLLITGAILLFLLTGSIAFLSSRKLYGDAITGIMRFGVVYGNQSPAERIFISSLASQDTLKELTEFKETTEVQGRSDLEQGKIQALVMLPPDFIGGIIRGENIPARLILNENQALQARLLQSLTEAGAKTLSASQGALYAAWDIYTSEGRTEEEKVTMNQKINERYLALALGRGRSFDIEVARATGDMDPLMYFLSSWMILFLLLMGMLEAFVMRPLTPGMRTKLEIEGIGPLSRIFTDWLRLFLLQLLFLGAILFVWSQAAPRLGLTWAFDFRLLAGLAAVALAVAAFILFVYTVARDLLSAMLFLFASAFVMVFLSGGFIPSSFLPAVLRRFQVIVPTTSWIGTMGDLFSAQISLVRIGQVLITGVVFYLLAYASDVSQSRRRMRS